MSCACASVCSRCATSCSTDLHALSTRAALRLNVVHGDSGLHTGLGSSRRIGGAIVTLAEPLAEQLPTSLLAATFTVMLVLGATPVVSSRALVPLPVIW